MMDAVPHVEDAYLAIATSQQTVRCLIAGIEAKGQNTVLIHAWTASDSLQPGQVYTAIFINGQVLTKGEFTVYRVKPEEDVEGLTGLFRWTGIREEMT